MALFEMVMPSMGESIMECTVLNILKKVGDYVDADDSVLEVATDKVDTEVPAPHSGYIKEILVKINDVVPVGNVVLKIETSAEVIVENHKSQNNFTEQLIEVPFVDKIINKPKTESRVVYAGTRFYSPLVQNIARTEGITASELENIVGTGTENRVTKNDILEYIVSKNQELGIRNHNSSTESRPLTTHHSPPAPNSIPMDRMRKMIAERMVESKRISAHVTSFVECDMTHIVKWRNENKDRIKEQTGENLTFTPILIDAIVKAIKDFPAINISVDGDYIINKPDINIGMAVALPSGNLIVPVIHKADQYDLLGLSAKVNDLAARARNNKLTADDLAGGTYTISNIGMFGNIMGTPIIVQPQVAIMAFGAIQKKPVVIESNEGDRVEIRSTMYLSHSYDHRVVDGALGGLFVKRVADYLEQFNFE